MIATGPSAARGSFISSGEGRAADRGSDPWADPAIPSPAGQGKDATGPPPARLLAVDAGLRAGLAIYTSNGRLESYRSTNFGSFSRLKKGVYGVIAGVRGLTHVVVEGGGTIADPWLREIERRELAGVRVDAGVWREVLLLPRDRRSGIDAKQQADVVARRIIDWSGAPRPTSLRHDAAEAILVGLWGVLEAGWMERVPAELRQL